MNVGRYVCSLTLAAALGIVAGSGTASAGGQVPAETSSVTVEGTTVTISLTTGALPSGDALRPEEVRVTAAGQTWPATARVLDTAQGNVPRTAVLAVDTSGSMGASGISDAQAAAQQFLDVLPPDVSVGLVTFSEQATLAVPPTTDRAAVQGALAAMRPAGNTTLYDAVEVALAALGTEGDRALVVLSDGKDTASTTSLDAVAAALDGSGASVDFVAFRTEQNQVQVLTDLAARAGGRVTEVATGTELTTVFATAARALVNHVLVTTEVPAGVSGPTDLQVEVPAGSVSAVVQVPVELTPAPSAGAGATGEQTASPAEPSWIRPEVMVPAFLVLFVLFALLLDRGTWKGSASTQRSRQVERYGLVTGTRVHAAGPGTPGSVTQTALGWADRTVEQRELKDSWSLTLDRAAIPLQPKEWLIIRLAAALVGFAAAVVLLPWWLLTGPLTALAGWSATGLYARVKASLRLKRFADALPDVLQLTAGSLKTGFSLPQAVDNAAKDGEEPIAGELSRALAESRLGVPLEDALERVAHRMKSTDLAWTVMAIRISREVGGNLAEVLLSTAETMRERSRILRQVKALAAEGKLSAYILLGLPVFLTLFMVLFRRSYIAPLVTDPIGWVMVIYGLLSVTVGAWFMSRMIKLEV